MNKDQILTTAMILDYIVWIGTVSLAHYFPMMSGIIFLTNLVFSFWLCMMLYEDMNHMEFAGFIGGITVLNWQDFKLIKRG
jgi:hypothetical protein